MKMLNEKDLMYVNGGFGCVAPDSYASYKKKRDQKEQLEQEQRRLEGIADIRMRAGEDALKAAMRLNRQEAEIKEAMKAQQEALGLT